MPHELLHTSALRGLHLGSDGYCTVGETEGIPRSLSSHLEQLSSYRHRVKKKTPDLTANPVAFSHRLLASGGQRYHVVSRIADAGFDHTNRTNYIAHHVALTSGELPDGGPAWLCQQAGLFQTEWATDRKPQHLPNRRVPEGESSPRKCKLWERTAGDAGWAGVLAGTHDSRSPVTIIYSPGQPVIDLLAESLALLPSNERWQVSFNTYYTSSSGSDCQWRFVPTGSPEAKEALESQRGLVLRLDEPMVGTPSGNLVAAARTGAVARTVVDIVDEDRPATRSSAKASPAKRSRRSFLEDDEPIPVPSFADDEPRPKLRRVVEPDEPAPAAVLPPASSPLKPLVMGLALGLGLAFIGLVLLDLAAGQSILRMAGVKSKPETELEEQKNAAEKAKEKADEQKIAAEKARTEAENEANRLRIQSQRPAPIEKQPESKPPVRKPTDFDLEIPIPFIGGRIHIDSRKYHKPPMDDTKFKEEENKRKEAERTLELQKRALELLKKKRLKTISLSVGQPVSILPAGTKASIDLLRGPASSTHSPSNTAGKLTITGEQKVGETYYEAILTYDEAKGTLALSDEKNPEKRPALWSQAILKVHVGEKGKADERDLYVQLAHPERPLWKPGFGPKEQPKDFVFDKTGSNEWAFHGTALLSFVYPTKDGSKTESFCLFPESENDGPVTKLIGRPREGVALVLELKQGSLSMNVDGLLQTGTVRVFLRSVDIVSQKTTVELPTPAVVYRFQEPEQK